MGWSLKDALSPSCCRQFNFSPSPCKVSPLLNNSQEQAASLQSSLQNAHALNIKVALGRDRFLLHSNCEARGGLTRTLPQAVAAKRTIGKIASLAAFGQERFTSAVTGRSDPVARMTAARMAAE